VIRLAIDGRPVEVEPGATVLDAARRLGIDIPSMCHVDGLEPSSSCLLCIVRVNGSDRLVPSCVTRAEEGMEVESETPEIHDARRMALELLLGDHLGECLAPCHRICPLDLDIPRMMRRVQAGDLDDAIAGVRDRIPFPGILGRVCAARCEVGCRRGAADEPLAIRNVERHVGDAARERRALPACAPDSGRRVAVVGGGPAGLSAAFFLRRAGHAVTVVERAKRIGGRLRRVHDPADLPEDVLDAELAILERLGVEIRCGVEVASVDSLASEHDAVLVAAAGIEVPDGVHRAGDAEKVVDDPARAMASGRDAAAAIDARLAGREWAGPAREFSTTIGRLTEPEVALYLKNATEDAIASRSDDAVRESARCMRCDCRGTPTCLLKKYGESLGASPKRFKPQRRLFTQNLDHPLVIYEPGKCIACGICVTLTREAGETLGLTFVGRGFDVRVGVPFDAPLAEALREAAERVVLHCPTGALEIRDEAREKESS
jgi:ferredoxin